jgi:ABC-2 type transport system ATP-binding protein
MPRPDAMNAISVERLGKRFFRHVVLDDLSFAVLTGGVTGLIGENGVGKTTLIRILLGLIEPNQGRGRVLGLDSFTQGVAIRRRTGYVPDSFRLYGWMTTREILDFVGAFHPTWDAGLAETLRQQMDLPPRQKTATFSKGMKTRLLLVAAMAHRPDLLLLDEPLSGLDPIARRDVLRMLAEFAAEEGKTVLIASHQIEDIERLCDRVVLIHRGRALLDERIETLRATRGDLLAVFPGPVPEAPAWPDVDVLERTGNSLLLHARRDKESICRDLTALGAEIEETAVDLETLFRRAVERAGRETS